MTEKSNNKASILLVDDLSENLQLLSELLMQLGYGVRSVTSGRMALKTLNAKQADLILLDIKMPDMDGYEVCKSLKAHEDLCDIPVIFISALDDTLDKVKAFQCGGVDYISRPLQFEEVVARIENQLTIQRQKNELQQEIKKRQEIEEMLYQSRALLASVLNATLDGIAALQAVHHPKTGKIEDFRCVVVNPVIAKMFRKNREELMGKLILKRLLQRVNADFFQHFVAVVEKGKPLEKDFYHASEDLWFHFVAVKLGDGFAVSVRDITSRKKMELELQAANQELQSLAHIDGLTKIANRRYLDGYLVQEWRRLSAAQQPLSILMLDVDHFKCYNDSYGHQYGDDCLIQIVHAIKKALAQPNDLLARYGGEEFVIILPETNQPDAVTLAQAIHNEIAALAIPHLSSPVSDIVTVSIGIANLIPAPNYCPDYLIDQADKALYTAKQQGRNRYVVQALGTDYYQCGSSLPEKST